MSQIPFFRGRSLRAEAGAVTPIMMIISTLLTVTGVAFLSMGSFREKTIANSLAAVQSEYNAEAAARVMAWRVANSPSTAWPTISYTDTAGIAKFDTTTKTIIAAGWYGDVLDSVTAQISLGSDSQTEQMGHIIVYKKSLTLGPYGSLYYSSPANAPYRQRNWWGKIKLGHSIHESSRFFKESEEWDDHGHKKTKKKDVLHTYIGNQTFDSVLDDGIHYVKGNVILRGGMRLDGSLLVTGTVSFKGSGTITINADKVPSKDKNYPGYYPAIAAMRTTDVEQDVDGDETEDTFTDGTPTIIINGLVFSRRAVNLSKVTIRGAIYAEKVTLSGTYSVTYDSKYMFPYLDDYKAKESRQQKLLSWKTRHHEK